MVEPLSVSTQNVADASLFVLREVGFFAVEEIRNEFDDTRDCSGLTGLFSVSETTAYKTEPLKGTRNKKKPPIFTRKVPPLSADPLLLFFGRS